MIQDVFVLAHLGIPKKQVRVASSWGMAAYRWFCAALRHRLWVSTCPLVRTKNRQQDFPGAGGICQIYTPEKSNPELTQNASNRHKGDNCPCSKVIKCTYLCYQVKCPVDMVNKSHHLPVSSWLTFNVVVCLCRWNQEGFANTPSSRRFLGVLFPPIPLACPSLPKEKAQNQTTS